MNIRVWLRLMLVLLALPASLATVQAQGITTPTFDRIRDHGAIYVGHGEASIPFSYMVGDDVVGYSADACARIVNAIREKLGIPGLKVVRVPVSNFSSTLMLLTGSIDLDCSATTTNTSIRQQRIAFGFTTFVSGIKALVLADSSIDRIGDLAGRVVVTTAGTSMDRLVRTVLAKRNIGARAESAATNREAYSMVLSRQADAFVLDEVALAELLAGLPAGVRLKSLAENFGFEPYGIAMRKDDPDFKKLVDDVLGAMMKNGEMERLYNKWFMSPIPPNNINLKIPMSDLLRELLRNPSDTGI